MCNLNVNLLLNKLAIACIRFKEDHNNPKRLITLDNLIEEIKELYSGKD